MAYAADIPEPVQELTGQLVKCGMPMWVLFDRQKLRGKVTCADMWDQRFVLTLCSYLVLPTVGHQTQACPVVDGHNYMHTVRARSEEEYYIL